MHNHYHSEQDVYSDILYVMIGPMISLMLSITCPLLVKVLLLHGDIYYYAQKKNEKVGKNDVHYMFTNF